MARVQIGCVSEMDTRETATETYVLLCGRRGVCSDRTYGWKEERRWRRRRGGMGWYRRMVKRDGRKKGRKKGGSEVK